MELIGSFEEKIPELFGKGLAQYVEEQAKSDNAWILYNHLTHHISHYFQRRMRAAYQMKVSLIITHIHQNLVD
jgi:hypothetical protein